MVAMLRTIGIFDGCGRRRHRFYLPLAALALASCSSADPVEQQSKTTVSAAQTAVMIVDAWLAGTIPLNYASATLQSLAGTLADANRQMQSGNSPESAERRRVTTAISRLSAVTRRAEAGVEAGSRPKVSQAQLDIRSAMVDLAAAYARYLAPTP
jgi:hypothetical protein